MADTYAKVSRPGYTFRGHSIRVGTTVKVTGEQLESAGRKNPPYLEKTSAPKSGHPYIDLTVGLDMPQAALPAKTPKDTK